MGERRDAVQVEKVKIEKLPKKTRIPASQGVSWKADMADRYQVGPAETASTLKIYYKSILKFFRNCELVKSFTE